MFFNEKESDHLKCDNLELKSKIKRIIDKFDIVIKLNEKLMDYLKSKNYDFKSFNINPYIKHSINLKMKKA